MARLVLIMAVSGCLAASPADAVAANLLANPSFEATGAGWLAPWSFTQRTGAAGAIRQATLGDGSRAAQIDVTQQSSSEWLVQLSQANVPLSSGQTYTVSFAARASTARQIGVLLQGTPSPYTTYLARNFNLSTSWASYSVTYTATSTVSDVSLRFNLASALGTVWIDNVSVESGTSQSTTTLSPTADAYVRADSPSQNFGSAATLISDGSPAMATYMKFDLSSFAGKTISRAVLRLKVENPSSATQAVRTATDTAWRESAITYANRPALGSAVTTFPGAATGAWIEVDVTSAVAARAGLPITLGIDSTNGDGFAFYSQQAPADRLHLVVQVASAPPPPPPPPPINAKGVALRPFAEYWGSNLDGMRSDFADMAAAGITWARIDLHYSSSPNPDFDAAVQAARTQGIQLLAVVYKSPPANDLGTDAQRATFRAWLAQMVARYKYHIRHWEIHNEPNLHDYWNIDEVAGSDQARYTDAVRRYVTHLRDGFETVKANDSGATVLFGGLSVWTVERYMDVLLTTDAHRYFDLMSFHAYGWTPDHLVADFTSFRSKMRLNENYASKPIWVTETGFNTSWFDKGGYVTSEQQKADYLVRSLRQLYALGATLPLFVYTLHENETSPGYGLTSKDPVTLRTTYFPAFYAYRDLAF